MKLKNTYSVTSNKIANEINFIIGVSIIAAVISALRLWFQSGIITQSIFIISTVMLITGLYLDSVLANEDRWLCYGNYDVTNPQILTNVEREALAENPVEPICVGYRVDRHGHEDKSRPVIRRLVKLFHKENTDLFRYSLDRGQSWIYVSAGAVKKHRFQHCAIDSD